MQVYSPAIPEETPQVMLWDGRYISKHTYIFRYSLSSSLDKQPNAVSTHLFGKKEKVGDYLPPGRVPQTPPGEYPWTPFPDQVS